MMKRFGRGFISLLLVVMILMSGFTILSTSAASDVQSVTFNLSGVTGEDVNLKFTATLNNTPFYSIMSGSGLSANDEEDEYGIFGIDGYVKLRFNGTGDAIFGATRETGLNIENNSFGYDIICNYIMEDGTFNYDQCTGCTIDPEAALIRVPAGETAVLSFTTPKSNAYYMYFTVLNFRAVGASNEYDIYVLNDGPGTLTLHNNYDDYEEEIYSDGSEYGAYTATYDAGIDFTFDNSEDPDYNCIGLIDDDNNFYGIDSTFRPTKSTMLYPVILDAETTLFKVENMAFTDLNEAAQAAVDTLSKRVILVKDGVLHAGDYTLPEGVSLLIPFDDANTMYTSKPASVENARVTSRFAYRKLIMEEGANITVEDGGAISVSAKHPSTTTGSGTQYNGAVAGGYGWIYMEEGSTITLNGASNLYAWGFITGDGFISANSGSTVYEFFQINDFRGGTITSRMADPVNLNQFPLNQYYVQNIEAHLRINHGAVENVLLELYAGGKSIGFICSFIDKDDSDQCMFRLKTEGSYLEKYYDYTTDKMEYVMSGDADIDAITLSLSGVTISSADYYLPISNINVTIKEGSSLTTDKKVVFLPGSSVTVEEGAEIVVTSGEYSYIDNEGQESTKTVSGSVIFAAKDDIGKYSANGGTTTYPCKPVLYTPTAHPTRTWATTEETFLDNNGSITVAEGAALSSSSEKAEIYSSTGNGTFTMEGDNATSEILTSYQSYNESTNTIIGADVSVVPAIVHDDVAGNDETDAHSTSATWGIPATFRKVNGVWGDYRNVTWIDLDGSVKQTMSNLAYDVFLTMDQPAAMEKPADDFASYEFLYWGVDTVDGNEVTVVPVYKTIRDNCTVTWLVDGNQYSQASVEYGTNPVPPNNPTKARDNQYTYTFAGWTSDGGATILASTDTFPMVLDDITYTAVFTTTLRNYSIRFSLWVPPASGTGNGSTVGTVTKSKTDYGTVFTNLYDTLYSGVNLVERYQALTNTTDDYAFIGWATGNGDKAAKDAAKAGNISIMAGQDVFIDGTFTYVYAVFAKVQTDYYVNHSISLYGNIGVNFYIALPEGDNAADYTIGYTFRNEYNEPAALADFYDAESGKYKFTVNAEAPQMTDDVTAILFKNGTAVDSDIYKVADYSAEVFSNEETELVEGAYYLVGTINGQNCWADQIRPEYRFVRNSGDTEHEEYMLRWVEMKAGDVFKVVQYSENGCTYYPDLWDNNPTPNKGVDADGTYTIYFRPNYDGDLGDPWYYRTINITAVKDLKSLLRAMLHYGATAQEYFTDKDYAETVNPVSAADFIDDPALVNYPAVTDAQLAAAVNGEATELNANTPANTALALYGLKYYGVSSVLGANTTLRIYFNVVNSDLYEANKGNITFGFNDEAAAPELATENGKYIYIEYDKIAAAKINDLVTMKINNVVILKYSVMDYLRKALADAQNKVVDNVITPDIKLINLVTAMYHYNLEADSYFG